MSVMPTGTPSQDPGVVGAQADASDRLQELKSTIADFDPSSETGPKPDFNESLPQDHMQDLMKVAPIWMAFAALGGKFAHQSGLTMLTSTNAMMRGIVQGNSEAYAVARAKYDADYEAFKDKQKTWIDTYRAYSQAYKGRVDAAVQAYKGANTAVGIAEAAAKNAETQQRMMMLLPSQIAEHTARVHDLEADAVKKAIDAQATVERVKIAQQNANTHEQQTAAIVKNADTRTLSGLAKSLHDEMDELIKQYKKGEVPPDVQVQVQSLKRQIDGVNEKLKSQFGVHKDVQLPPGAVAPAPGQEDGTPGNKGQYVARGGFWYPNK